MENTKLKSEYKKSLLGTKFHNSWRSILYTNKGKKIGFDERWKLFENFKNDMFESHSDGKILSRKNKSDIFSKENCIWINKGEENDHKLITLEYNGEVKTLVEWSLILGRSYSGIKTRYHKKLNSVEEILFGVKKKPRRVMNNFEDLNISEQRKKVSKMISSYKIKDLKKNYENNLDVNWFIENISNKNCYYCDTNKYIGADRIDNNKGHMKDNILPCCYRCNTIRSDFFSVDEMKKIGLFIKENITIK